MTEADFRALVCRMRKAQRDYFRTRDRVILDESKRLEREVDAEIGSDQPSLFPESAG